MKRLLNWITINLFGVYCYPDKSEDNYTPTFRTSLPEEYIQTSEGFNKWARTVNVSCQYYSKLI